MDVIGHQTPSPHRDSGLPDRRREQIAIGGVVAVRKKDLLPAIAALRDMIGQAGDDDACETGH